MLIAAPAVAAAETGNASSEAPAPDTDPVGSAAAPAPPADHYADQTYGTAAMASSRLAFQQENGGQHFSQMLLNLAELRWDAGQAGYHWDGEGWYGGDVNRLVVKSEGDSESGHELAEADVQALYSRAVGPYFDLQAGARESFGATPSRTYATVGVEGLAPYAMQLSGALFVSTRGDLFGRFEGYYDQYVTQRWVLQPRVELNFAAQNVPEERVAAGLTEAELGLRLRYEIRRECAPYVGVSWDRRRGSWADVARNLGENTSTARIVAGVRAWL